MELRRCHAKAATGRAIVALLMPLAFYLFIIVNFAVKGYSLSHDVEFIMGALTTPKALMGHGAILFWVWRIWPPAWEALWHGPYLVTSKDETLFLPRDQQLALSDVTSVDLHRNLWGNKVAVIEMRRGRVSFAADFMTKNSEQRFLALAPR
jgi:hypothetical protein